MSSCKCQANSLLFTEMCGCTGNEELCDNENSDQNIPEEDTSDNSENELDE